MIRNKHFLNRTRSYILFYYSELKAWYALEFTKIAILKPQCSKRVTINITVAFLINKEHTGPVHFGMGEKKKNKIKNTMRTIAP